MRLWHQALIPKLPRIAHYIFSKVKHITMESESYLNPHLKHGKQCIGQSVISRDGYCGVITDMYVINGKKCMVTVTFDDGSVSNREKFFVKVGSFNKPYNTDIDGLLKDSNWAHCYGYEDRYIINKYTCELVSIAGRYKGRYVTQMPHRGGYKTYTLYDKYGRRKLKFVHRIVVESFLRPVNVGEQVNHIDGDKSNNSIYNLEITSRHQNNKKYFDFESFGIDASNFDIIARHCIKSNINLNEFIRMSLLDACSNISKNLMGV